MAAQSVLDQRRDSNAKLEGAFGHPLAAGILVAFGTTVTYGVLWLFYFSNPWFSSNSTAAIIIFFLLLLSYPVVTFVIAPLVLFWKKHRGWGTFEIAALVTAVSVFVIGAFLAMFLMVLTISA